MPLRAAAVAAPALAFTLSFSGRYQHWLTITLILTLQPFYAAPPGSGRWMRIGGTVLGGMLAAVIAIRLHHPDRHRRRAVPAGRARLRPALRQLRRLHLLPHPAGGLAHRIQPTRQRRAPDRRHARPLYGDGRRAGRCRRHAALAELGARPAAQRSPGGARSPCLLRRGRPRLPARHHPCRRRRTRPPGRRPRQQHPSRRPSHAPCSSLAGPPPQACRTPWSSTPPCGRMAGRLSMLQLDPHHADGMPAEALRAWRAWIGGTLRGLAAGQSMPGSRPEGRVPDALARIAQQIEMLRGAPARLRRRVHPGEIGRHDRPPHTADPPGSTNSRCPSRPNAPTWCSSACPPAAVNRSCNAAAIGGAKKLSLAA